MFFDFYVWLNNLVTFPRGILQSQTINDIICFVIVVVVVVILNQYALIMPMKSMDSSDTRLKLQFIPHATVAITLALVLASM